LVECATGQIARLWRVITGGLRFERPQASLAGRDMAALQLVGIEQPFTPACTQSLHAFKLARGVPRKLAGFHPS